MRVVVVGAGMAGLTATRLLTESGGDVELIEAGQRVGGRARTVRDRFVHGQFAESGAEWVDTAHTRMLALLDRHGLGLLGEGEQWTTLRRWLHRNGVLISADDLSDVEPGLLAEFDHFDSIVSAVAAGIADPARPQDHPTAATIDAQSLADVARQANLGAIATLFKLRDSQGEFAEEPNGVSLLFAAQQRAQADATDHGGDGVRSHRIVEGLDSLVQAMAAEVETSLRLGEALVAIEHDAHHVVVHTSTRSLHVDQVVITCTLPALRWVRFDPVLPQPVASALTHLGYGTVTKTAVQFAHRSWSAGYTTSDGRAQRAYDPTVDRPGETGIIMSYCGGNGGRELVELDETTRLDLIAGELQAMHRMRERVVGGFSRAWSGEPRFGGSYACYGPGQVTQYWEALRRPLGRIWLAGEHTATCTGYLEGAVEAAETVSAAIVAQG